MPCATGSNSHNFTVLAAEAGTIFCTRCGEIRRALPAAGPQSSRRSSASAAVQQEPSLHHHPLPYGTIVLWSNSYDTIPDGWQLCDGTNGTPDLRDRFVVGAEGNYPPHVTGGATHHTLQANHMPLHDHRRDQSRRREYPIVEYMLPPGIASERVVRFEHVQVGHNEEPRRVWMMHHEPETYTAPEGMSPRPNRSSSALLRTGLCTLLGTMRTNNGMEPGQRGKHKIERPRMNKVRIRRTLLLIRSPKQNRVASNARKKLFGFACPRRGTVE